MSEQKSETENSKCSNSYYTLIISNSKNKASFKKRDKSLSDQEYI